VSHGDLVRVRVSSIADNWADAAWAEGQEFNIPRDLPGRCNWSVTASGELSVKRDSTPTSPQDIVELRERAAFTDRPPASSRLPISYQRVPGRVRALVGSMIGRWNRGRAARWAAFPSWPLDLSADLLFDLSLPTTPSPVTSAPVILTHDIDSAEGLKNLVERFLPVEEAVGAHSTSFIVPCAWKVDRTATSEILSRGHEIGVHGFDHSNLTPFAGDADRRRRLDAALPFAKEHQSFGYRAPSLLRTKALLRDLGTRYAYDSSIPTSGGLFPVPNNGCASARPWAVVDRSILELPLSMPRDGSLRFLGYSPDEIAALWIDCADAIARSRGVVVLLTHCERRFSGSDPMFGAYRKFLEHVAGRPDRFAFKRAVDVARAL
jgi:peptidoglycan/xylan/chitin deacetylase (PgdA/CDA1 family)